MSRHRHDWSDEYVPASDWSGPRIAQVCSCGARTTAMPEVQRGALTRYGFAAAWALSAAAFGFCTMAACAPPQPAQLIPPVLVVHEDYDGPIDVDPPTRLDIVMSGTDAAAVERCNHMGGRPVFSHDGSVLVCENVDY